LVVKTYSQLELV